MKSRKIMSTSREFDKSPLLKFNISRISYEKEGEYQGVFTRVLTELSLSNSLCTQLVFSFLHPRVMLWKKMLGTYPL
jgi:hypothetical protein